jgi:hypothetical protein
LHQDIPGFFLLLLKIVMGDMKFPMAQQQPVTVVVVVVTHFYGFLTCCNVLSPLSASFIG